MHIPDGYLSPSTCATLAVAAAPFWYVAVQRLKKTLTTKMVPVISIFAAFSFVVMMFNLPLPGGTTGHAVGMGIATIVLGPWGSMIAISVALVLQAILFGDGGILAIGANCLNMAIIGSIAAYYVYRAIAGKSALTSARRVVAGAIAGYVAINVSALAAGIEFGVQPLLFKDPTGVPLYSFYPLAVAIPAMMIGHLTIAGLAEAIATGGIVAYLQRADVALLRTTAPELDPNPPSTKRLPALVIGLLVLCLATPLGLLAAGTAWGEWGTDELAAQQSGFYMRNLPPDGAKALETEFAQLAMTTTDSAAAADYTTIGTDLAAGKITEAADLVQARIGDLRGADPAKFPQLAAMTSTIKDPPGLKAFNDLWRAPLANYAPGLAGNETIGYVISALVGVLVVAGGAFVIGRIFARREPEKAK